MSFTALEGLRYWGGSLISSGKLLRVLSAKRLKDHLPNAVETQDYSRKCWL